MNSDRLTRLLPAFLGALALLLLVLWFWPRTDPGLTSRIPGTDQAPGAGSGAAGGNPVLQGQLQSGNAQPSAITDIFPQFRGVDRDGLVKTATPLARSWNPGQPRQLWSIPVGEGYAGPVVWQGRVYLMDYDRERQHDALRCLSLEDGREIWRFSYPIKIKRNHGMSRTVPTIHSNLIVAIGPKCHVLCLDAITGELKWGIDMVRQFGATIPPWYTGQCPLIENDLVILAPGGPQALLAAVKLYTGELVWTTPNPRGWKMTHASLMAGELAGQRTFVYCASGGVAGVDPNGSLLWDTADWKISIATVPSPLLLSPDRVFLTGGYNAGSMMLQIDNQDGKFSPRTLFRLDPKVFGATQHSPILYKSHIYGVHPDGEFVCLDQDGKTLWSSGRDQRFGLGPFLIANDLIFALNDSGLLSLISASPDRFQLLGQTKVLTGRESWGPLALAGDRLLVRDLQTLACLAVGE
ncbi:MAG: PQQ-binding-like beta-propeller repeat protein [Verrucomicrobia bacterium]|nr:PQQ-binding-like beta-propeller repeat protein [Verrucomicrobiota bacterium]